MVRLFEDHCDCGFITMKFHLDRLGDDLKKFRSIPDLHETPYEHFNVSRKGAYRRNLMRSTTRMRETAFALKPIAYGLK